MCLSESMMFVLMGKVLRVHAKTKSCDLSFSINAVVAFIYIVW